MRINGMASAACRRHRVSLPSTHSARLGAAVLLLGLLAPTAPVAGQVDSLRLESYRFWREPDLTQAEVFAVIPLHTLTFELAEGARRASYRGTLEIRDSTGLTLRQEQWDGSVSLPPVTEQTLSRATTSEHFTYSLKPGLYTAQLEIVDSLSGRVERAETRIRAPARRPAHSDLLIASDFRRLEQGEEAVRGSFRRGTLVIVPSFGGSLSSDRTRIGLVMEVYRAAAVPESASVSVTIEGRNRNLRQQTPAQARVYPPGGGIEAFAMDLAGLPPGEYDLELAVAFAADTLRAQHPLLMLQSGAGELHTASDLPYSTLDSEALDSVWGPMTYLASPQENEVFLSLSSADAKRRFIQQFWQRRAAGTGSDATLLREEFEERVQYAQREFRPPRVGRSTLQGWQTDRGRIWILFGPPAERHVEYERKDQTNPWEVWRYIQGRGDKFVFWDRSGFGEFILVHSTDRDFLGVPGWERYFTEEALELIQRF